ncbi:uncharacterized protein [Spinacia oleracea]|uniref:Phorbol-ester/DAG-type domain-containing protein n=1 Tax=Spinacia oleracea TaxID=3562 RepID=A0A9R0ICG5_SPIOL|nr:uncharacterized protein LOC110786485 [Spinacia oleracea]
MTSDKMSHPSHPEHPLQKVNYQNEYTCDGCKMKGTRERYRCEKCDFDLHIDCVTCPNITVQGQNCQFLEKPRLGIHCKKVDCTECRSCDACGMTIKGFVYHCRTTDWDFHPRCAKLEDQITIDDVMFRLEKQQPSSCAWCNKKRLKGGYKKIPGWSYVSNKNDGYNFHVYCVMEMAMQNLSSALQAMNQPEVKTKSKKLSHGLSSTSNKWVNVLKAFLGAVFSILLGDPTTLIGSTMAHLVIQGLLQAGSIW